MQMKLMTDYLGSGKLLHWGTVLVREQVGVKSI
jgi:hypothetical protein